MSKPFETYVNLAPIVPSVQSLSAIWIVAEIGTDMSAFQDAEHLVSWAELSPTNNEST